MYRWSIDAGLFIVLRRVAFIADIHAQGQSGAVVLRVLASAPAEASMRTREVLRWNHGVRDLLGLAALSIAGAALVALDAACDLLEQFIDAASGEEEPS